MTGFGWDLGHTGSSFLFEIVLQCTAVHVLIITRLHLTYFYKLSFVNKVFMEYDVYIKINSIDLQLLMMLRIEVLPFNLRTKFPFLLPSYGSIL